MKKTFKIRKWLIIAGFLLVWGFFFLGMVRNTSDEKTEVILVAKIIDDNNDFWTSFVQGTELAAKEYGVGLTIVGPESETMYEKQGELIEEAIAKHPDVIVLVPSHFTETQKYARKIEEAGIRLLLADSVMEESMGSCAVATDNVEAGRKMGQYIVEHFSGVECIGVVGHVKGVSTATEREAGLREGLGTLEKKITDVVFCDSDYRKAYVVTKEMLERHPQMNVIVGLNEYSSVGAARAVSDLGLSGKIKMIGFDSSIKEVEYLEDGTFEAIVVQKPLNMGYLCIETAVDLMNRKEIPEYVNSGSALITKETMYTEENQKLLFPI